jgi:putative ABC transport system permease protein
VTGAAVLKAALGGAASRRVQTTVIFLVLAAGTAAALLGLTLATSSHELLQAALTRHHGPGVGVTAGSAKVTLPPQISWFPAAEGINTPLAVAFAVIALVLAVLITASVVSAAVVAGYRRVGVLKSIGFTPAQVAAAYLAQIGLPALAGAIAGTGLGNWQVLPLLNQGSNLFHLTVTVPLWINITVPLGLCALAGLAALVPALRAGRLRAIEAIAAGQVPRAGHRYAAHRLAAKIPLPRPVTAGLAAPFTCPARSAVTLAVITFGLTAVVLATGLDASLAKINHGGRQWRHWQVIWAGRPGAQQAFTPSQQQVVAAALRAQPGTLAHAAEATTPPQGLATPSSGRGPVTRGWSASVPGVGQHVPITAFQGNAAGLGLDMISGTWYHGPGQVVVNLAYPATASLVVGQTIPIIVGGTTVTAQITGTVYTPDLVGALITSWQTLRGAAGLAINQYIVAMRPGVNSDTYAEGLQRALGRGYIVTTPVLGQGGGVGLFADVDTSLIRLLTVLVAALAGLGVLNTVLMLTRERVHDLGVYKAVGMTPRQALTMVTCWAVPPAAAAAIVALPTGMALQDAVMQAIASDQATVPGGLGVAPASLVHVYTPGGLTLLALAGLAIAVIGALGPATWAAAARTTTALRAE